MLEGASNAIFVKNLQGGYVIANKNQMLCQIRSAQADNHSQIPASSEAKAEGNRTYRLCRRNRTAKSLRSRFSNAFIQTSRSKRSCCSSC